MQRLEISGAVRPIYGSLGVKRLRTTDDDTNIDNSFYVWGRQSCDSQRECPGFCPSVKPFFLKESGSEVLFNLLIPSADKGRTGL